MVTTQSIITNFEDLHAKRDYVKAVIILNELDVNAFTGKELMAWVMGSKRFYGGLMFWNKMVDRICEELVDRGDVVHAQQAFNLKS